jgi:hypothetical protein
MRLRTMDQVTAEIALSRDGGLIPPRRHFPNPLIPAGGKSLSDIASFQAGNIFLIEFVARAFSGVK